MPEIVNGIDYVMRYLDEYKIIFVDNPLGYHALLNTGTKCILLRKEASEENQIKYILHELVHLHPVFLSHLEKGSSLMYAVMWADKKIESQIEKIAQETYQKRPDIVDKIKKALEEAKKIYL